MPTVSRETSVEKLIDDYPMAAAWLAQKGIVCVRCGEVFRGTLGELMAGKHFRPEQIDAFLGWLNDYLAENKG